LVYAITAGPFHGSIRVSGLPTAQFTQQDIDSGLVSYQNDGLDNSADSFDFTVDDGKGAVSSATFNITIRQNTGDFNQNLVVDAGDYVLWRKTAGATGVVAYSGADGNGDTVIDQADYAVWQSHLGDVIGGAGGASLETLDANVVAAPSPVGRAAA